MENVCKTECLVILKVNQCTLMYKGGVLHSSAGGSKQSPEQIGDEPYCCSSYVTKFSNSTQLNLAELS